MRSNQHRLICSSPTCCRTPSGSAGSARHSEADEPEHLQEKALVPAAGRSRALACDEWAAQRGFPTPRWWKTVTVAPPTAFL